MIMEDDNHPFEFIAGNEGSGFGKVNFEDFRNHQDHEIRMGVYILVPSMIGSCC
jgi:hypothetical protein